MKPIYVADETLKLMTEERASALLFREKAALASGIMQKGVDALELPSIMSPREDAILIRTIASNAHGCRICLPAGYDEKSVREAASCLSAAENPCLQVEFPLSAVQLEYKLGMKEEKALEKISFLTAVAKECVPAVEFIARDAAGAGREFLLAALRAAVSAGACAVTLYDDSGSFTPSETEELVKAAVSAVPVPVYYRPSNSIGFAAANALSALSAGASGVKTALSGDNALPAPLFASVFEAKGASLDLSCGLDLTQVKTSVKELLKSVSHEEAPSVSASSGIYLDASSTAADVEASVVSLGYALSPEDTGRVTDAVHNICRKKSSIGAKELEAVVASNAMQVPATYHLASYLISTGSHNGAMASIHLTRGEDTLSGVSTGDGPIDSAFRAIEQSLGTHYELDDFQIQAVTEGKESLGSALVCLRSSGKRYSGTGISADIVGASIRAYINALNKIVYEEDRA